MAGTKSRRRNARGEGGRLRTEIVEAALRVVDDDRGLTLTAIAAEAGIATPSIYDHFPGVGQIRFELIRSCYGDLIEEVRTAQEVRQDPAARLEATCLAYVGYAERHPHRYELLFRGPRDPEEKAAVGGQGSAALQTLVDALVECEAAGLSRGVDPQDDALAIWAAIHGLATLRTSRPDFARLHDQKLMRGMVRRLALLKPLR